MRKLHASMRPVDVNQDTMDGFVGGPTPAEADAPAMGSRRRTPPSQTRRVRVPLLRPRKGKS